MKATALHRESTFGKLFQDYGNVRGSPLPTGLSSPCDTRSTDRRVSNSASISVAPAVLCLVFQVSAVRSGAQSGTNLRDGASADAPEL